MMLDAFTVFLNGKGVLGRMSAQEVADYCSANSLQVIEKERNYGVCDHWFGVDINQWLDKHGGSVDTIYLVPRDYMHSEVWNS